MTKRLPTVLAILCLLLFTGLLLCTFISFFGIGDTSFRPGVRWGVRRSYYTIECLQGTFEFSLSGLYPRPNWRNDDATCTITGGDSWSTIPGVWGQTTLYEYNSPTDGVFATVYRQVYIASPYPPLVLLVLPLCVLAPRAYGQPSEFASASRRTSNC